MSPLSSSFTCDSPLPPTQCSIDLIVLPPTLLPPKGSQSTNKVPRPPNAFIIYRRMLASQCRGVVATELSRLIGKLWREEPPERKAHFAQLAAEAERQHRIAFPNYKFRPIKRGTGKRAKQLAAIAEAAATASSSFASKARSSSSAIPPTKSSLIAARKQKANSLEIENILRRARRDMILTSSAFPPLSDLPAAKRRPFSRVDGASKKSARIQQTRVTYPAEVPLSPSSLDIQIKKEEEDTQQEKKKPMLHLGMVCNSPPVCSASLLFQFTTLKPASTVGAASSSGLKGSMKRERRSPSGFSSTSSLSSYDSEMSLTDNENEEDEYDQDNDDDDDEDYIPDGRRTRTCRRSQLTRRARNSNDKSIANIRTVSPTTDNTDRCKPTQLPMTPVSPMPDHSSTPVSVPLQSVSYFPPYNHQHYQYAAISLTNTSMESLTEETGPRGALLETASSYGSFMSSSASLLLSPTTTTHSSVDDSISECCSTFSLDDGVHQFEALSSGLSCQVGTALDTFEPECLASHHKTHWEGLQYTQTPTVVSTSASLQPALSFTYSTIVEPIVITTARASITDLNAVADQEMSATEFQMASIDILADPELMRPEEFRPLGLGQ